VAKNLDLVKKFIAELEKKIGETQEAARKQEMQEVAEKMKRDLGNLEEKHKSKTAEAKEKLEKGFALSEELIKNAPASYLGYRVSADFYRLKGDKAKAEEQIKKIEELNPESAGLRFVRGAILLDFDGKPGDAVKEFEAAIQKDAAFVKAQYFIGLALDKSDDEPGAIKAMETVLMISPNHPDAKYYLNVQRFKLETTKKLSELTGEK
jgi:predicted Zn-dependent protease